MARVCILLVCLCLTDAKDFQTCFSSNDCRGSAVESDQLESSSDCCAGLGLSYSGTDGSCRNCFSEETFINEGDEFSLAAFNNFVPGPFFAFGRIRLSVCPINATTATFIVQTTPRSSFGGLPRHTAPTVVTVEGPQRVTNSGERDKRIRVVAINGDQLSVIALAEEFTSSDTFKVLPMVNLPNDGYEYYGVSVPRTEVTDSNGTQQDPQGNSVMLVVTTKEDTVLTITATATIDLTEAVDGDLKEEVDSDFLDPGESLTIEFGRVGQTLYLGSLFDITGSRVVSNKPIAFFSGHECGTVPRELLHCDQMVEQIPPTSTWGKTFITVPIANRNGTDIFKIIASRDNTVISSVCNDSVSNDDIFLNAGEVEQFNISSSRSCYLESNNPVLLVQFSVANGLDDAAEGDPFMVVIPPVEQYRSSYIITAFEAPPQSLALNGPGTHFVNIMLPGDFDPGAVLFDGEPLSPDVFSPIPCIDEGTTFFPTSFPTPFFPTCAYGAQIANIAAGDHTIGHSDEGARLNVVVYWQSYRVGQGYPGGMTQRPIALPAVNFTFERFEVFENGTSATLSLTRSGDLNSVATVNIRTSEVATGQRARVREDFEMLETTVEFDEGVTEMVFNVTLVDDVFPEPDETFEVYLAVSPGVYITSPSSAFVTILNDDPDLPVMNISFVDTNITVREGVGVIEFLLEKTEGAVGPVSIRMFTMDGSANSVDDFVGFSEEITFEIEDLNASMSTLILDNLLVEADEEFIVSIEAIEGIFPVNVEDDIAIVTVVDNDVAVIGFDPVNYVVSEGDNVEVTVEILSGRLERNLSLEMSFVNGSAQVDSDFTVPATTLLTFGPSTTQIRRIITLVDDSEVEETESFLIRLQVAVNETREIVLAPREAQVTIEDSDEATISLSAVRQRTIEGGAGARVDISVQGTIGAPVDVALTTFNQNATADVDYTGITNMVVRLTREVPSLEVIIDILDDTDYEGPDVETFIAQICLLSGDNNGITIIQSTVELIIEDNDPRPVPRIGFSQSVYSVCESTREVLILLDSDGVNQQPVEVTYMTVAGTATSADFGAVRGTVTFQPGCTLQSFTIAITDDGIAEPTESFTLQLQSGGDSDIGEGTTEVRIQDDDSVVIEFNPTQYSVQENAGQVIINIARLTPISAPVSVVFCTLPATALDGSDFVGVTEQEVTFQPDGSPVQQVAVAILDDSINEAAEVFKVRLKPSEGDAIPVIIEEPSACVTIEDNDPRVALRISFSQGTYRFDEDEPTAIITIETSEANSDAITVLLTTSDGSANGTNDYVPLDSLSVTFAPFETIQFVALDIIDDDVLERDEDFFVTLVNSVTGATLDSATVIIENDDSVVLEFVDTTYSAMEGGVATVEVQLVGRAAFPVIANITTQDGTAIEPGDYAAVSVLVAFVPGEVRVRYSIAIQLDSATEETETFSVLLSSIQDAVIVRRSTATVLVEDFAQQNLCASNPCATNAVCTNTCGGFVCTCLPGFTGDGVSTCGCSDGDILLLDGGNALEGRVEICFGGGYGTVCDDLWNSSDATVVCRQLGFSDRGAVAFRNAFFGQGTGPIFLDDVGCSGTEQSLLQCFNIGVGNHNCDHSEDAGVRCQNATIGLERTIYTVNESIPFVEVCAVLVEGILRFDVPVNFSTMDNTAQGTTTTPPTRSEGPGFSNSLYTFNATVGDNSFNDEDDGFDFVGTLTTPYVLYGNSYQDVYVGSNGQVSFGNGTSSLGLRFPTSPPLVTAFWNDINPVTGGIIYHRVINSGNELGDLRDRLRATPGGECLQFEPTGAAVVTFERVPQFFGSPDINNTFQVILLTNGTTSYSVFLYNSLAWGDGDTIIGFNDGTNFYTLAGGEGVSAFSNVTNLPFSSNVGVDGVYIYRTDSTSIQAGLQCPVPGADGDYEATDQLLIFAAGTNRICVEIAIFNDTTEEPDELFFVIITTTELRVNISRPISSVLIVDDDMVFTFEFEASAYTVGEEDNLVIVCVVESSNTTLPMSAEINVRSEEKSDVRNPATAGNDFQAVESFGSGIGPRFCYSFRIVNDGIPEEDEQFRVVFSNLPNGQFQIGSRSEACVTIEDDDGPCVDGDIRLRDGDNEFEGRVEVCLNRVFGTVCDDSWDVTDGDVVCRRLFGSTFISETCGRACFGQGAGPINLDNVDCGGNEESLLDCGFDPDTVDCSHAEDAGVVCFESDYDYTE